jgi:hypothetical protein
LGGLQGGGTIGPNDNTDPFNLPSFMAAGGETVADLAGHVDETHREGRWLIFCFHSILPPSDEWYPQVEIASITGGIAHARALGDVWVDTMRNVGAYWLGQKVLSAAAPTETGDQTVWSWTLPAHFPPGRYLRVKVDGGTLEQNGQVLAWSPHGYYEVSLDAGHLSLFP